MGSGDWSTPRIALLAVVLFAVGLTIGVLSGKLRSKSVLFPNWIIALRQINRSFSFKNNDDVVH